MKCFTYSWTILLFYCLNGSVFENAPYVFADVDTTSSGWAGMDSGYELPDGSNAEELYNEQDNTNAEYQFDDRFKQAPILSNDAFDSRISAIISDDLRDRQNVFGTDGSGKTSESGLWMDYDFFPKELIFKRDHGYGTRVRAGHNVANSLLAKNKLYGTYGPGRKRNANGVKDYLDFDYDGTVGADDYMLEKQKRLVSDSGYGSRIGAANKLARTLAAVGDVYGIYGPGKKR